MKIPSLWFIRACPLKQSEWYKSDSISTESHLHNPTLLFATPVNLWRKQINTAHRNRCLRITRMLKGVYKGYEDMINLGFTLLLCFFLCWKKLSLTRVSASFACRNRPHSRVWRTNSRKTQLLESNDVLQNILIWSNPGGLVARSIQVGLSTYKHHLK